MKIYFYLANLLGKNYINYSKLHLYTLWSTKIFVFLPSTVQRLTVTLLNKEKFYYRIFKTNHEK